MKTTNKKKKNKKKYVFIYPTMGRFAWYNGRYSATSEVKRNEENVYTQEKVKVKNKK